MAEPLSDPTGVPHEEKRTSENDKASGRRGDDNDGMTSTETSDGGVSSRSLSEREDSEITSSVSSVVDETPSVSTDEPPVSVRSEPEQAPSTSSDVTSEEAGQAVVSTPPSVPPSVPSSAPPSVQEHYYVKWITWKGEKTPIITQSENGPCPLLAIMNILFLRWKAKLPVQTEVITIEALMAHLGECVLSIKPREKAEGMELNFQQNMSDAMAVLPKLSTGLDVNVRFTGVTDFEYTPECIVFDLLDVPLYHGWLVDPQVRDIAHARIHLPNTITDTILTFSTPPSY